MKFSQFTLSLVAAALLLSSSALAAENNKGTLHLSNKVSLEGKVLAPGTYKVEWQGNGPTVQVTIVKGKETVSTFSAHLTDQAVASRTDAYSTASSPDGSQSLTTIYFEGKKYTLQVEQNQASQQSSAQPAN